MQNIATVNYHVHHADIQAFHIDTDGRTGVVKSPELSPTQIKIKDLRDQEKSVNFTDDSLIFLHQPTAVTDYDASVNWKEIYDRELESLLSKEIHAREVIVFDHTIRADDPAAIRKPARNVHGDYTSVGAHQRLQELVGSEKAREWEDGHFAFINSWRPIKNQIRTAPLGFIRPKSMQENDALNIELIYPDRTGQIIGLVHNDSHEWVYLSNMTPDEIAIFNVFDNQGHPYIAHSALDMKSPDLPPPRMSIESRMLVRY